MKPGRHDLDDVYQGDTYRRVLTLKTRIPDPGDPSGETYIPGAVINLTGYSNPKAQVRETTIATDVAAEIAVTILDQSTKPGQIEILMTAAQTTALTKTAYKWDLQLALPSGDVQTFLKGDVAVDAEVTHL